VVINGDRRADLAELVEIALERADDRIEPRVDGPVDLHEARS
jgi:hypothetical protein